MSRCQPKEKEDKQIMIAALVLCFVGLPMLLVGVALVLPISWASNDEYDGYFVEIFTGIILTSTGGSLALIAGILWTVLGCRVDQSLWKKYFNPEIQFAKLYFLYTVGSLVSFLIAAVTLAAISGLDFGEYTFYSSAAVFFFCFFGVNLIVSGVALYFYLEARSHETEYSSDEQQQHCV